MKHFIAEDFSALKKKRKSPTHFLRRGLKFLKKDHSKAIRLTGMIILVAAAAYFVNQLGFSRRENGYFSGSRGSPVVIPKIERPAAGKIAMGFPSYVPLSAEDGIRESYDATYSGNKVLQSSVIFSSQKSQEENFMYYLEWARDNSWDIVNLSDDPAFLYLKKGQEELNVSFNAGEVIISHLQKP